MVLHLAKLRVNSQQTTVRSLDNRMDASRINPRGKEVKKAGLWPWPENALRDSFDLGTVEMPVEPGTPAVLSL
jgi:NAD+--asparagine ADP-ribosyltransferase